MGIITVQAITNTVNCPHSDTKWRRQWCSCYHGNCGSGAADYPGCFNPVASERTAVLRLSVKQNKNEHNY